ncbi:CHAD domain-containing protein [Massilia sp. PWRC2]|uniref:CYTH and CHAD domain-containing protein n=1 Tax=Massilia sp. PWRC2 TaxID=2804626 RepID=UPI003CF85E9C
MEVELKLQVDAQYSDAILAHPLLSSPNAAAPREQKQVDIYYDTPERRLQRKHIGLRVRRIKNRWVQNIKGMDANGGNGGGGQGSNGAGLLSRGEWEWPVTGPAPELAHVRDLVDDKQVRRSLSAAGSLQKRLVAVFETRVKRTVWDLRLPEGVHIECALDRGTLECGEKEVAISELELELKAGDARQLFDLALGLQEDIPLQLGTRSKAERGYALLGAADAQAVKAAPVTLTRQMTVEQAFVVIAANCLAHMQGNDQRVARELDVESLHQMRVGMRRLRSALSMFKELLHLPQDMQTELDWLAGELGDARDWDVLSGSTLPAVAKKSLDGSDIAGVQHAASEQAHAHHLRTAQAVASPRYARLMLRLARWVTTMGWREDKVAMAAHGASLQQAVGKFARQVVKRDQRRLQRRAAKLAGATAEARHRLRIAAKKTRYAAEFFASLFAAKTVRPYVKGLSSLQDELGLMNDFAVAERLLSGLTSTYPDIEEGVGFVRGVLAADSHSDDKKIVRLWKNLAPLAVPS